MDTSVVLALASKPGHLWTEEEENAARDLLAAMPEPLPEGHVNLLFVLGDAEEARLLRQGATYAELED
jgi:hypothetical protein